ncbi:hypothetical protein [Verrucosispora sp. WMMD1129]|uniref:hypothetical protein n=1 Tax=Verrucosispora sp. WMMD1129 TaxID=3016093 RepID=UPI00249B7C0E|nr:hypothetical protein [Verrucosispora sp. WMMD1129]WFE45288.1 hypothetical protein O7624_13485 [Verrucosispora sp. WMMD1129]
MEPISIMLLAAVLTKMVTTHREDLEYARRGQESPRHKMKMARFRAAQQAGQAGVRAPARPGASGYLAELWYDAWEDLGEYRRRKRQERKDGEQAQRAEEQRQREESLRQWSRRTLNTRRDGRPVDDMVDVAGVRPTPGPGLCPVCLITAVPSGEDCPTCKFWRESNEATDRKLAEAERQPGGPAAAAQDEPAPEPRRAWRSPEEQDEAIRRLQQVASQTLKDDDPEMWKRTHVADDLTADDVLPNLLNGPAGAGHPNCDRCLKFYRVEDGRMVCDCTSEPADTRPLAPVIPLFPSSKHVEEIAMSNEVTGLSTALAFAEAASNAHQSFATTGAEGYVGALESGGNSGEVLTSAREAMEASGIAADKWAAHQAVLAKQMNLKEGYADNPDAADKGFLLNG